MHNFVFFVLQNAAKQHQQQQPVPALTPISRGSGAINHKTAMRIKSEHEDVDWLSTSETDDPSASSSNQQNRRVKRTVATALPHKKRIRSSQPVAKVLERKFIQQQQQLKVQQKPQQQPPAKQQPQPSPPKKLPPPPEPKPVMATPKEEPVDMMGMMSLTCEICNNTAATQLDFFRHLKLHYEPATLGNKVPPAPLPVDMKPSPSQTVVKSPVKPKKPAVTVTQVDKKPVMAMTPMKKQPAPPPPPAPSSDDRSKRVRVSVIHQHFVFISFVNIIHKIV